MKEKYNQKKKRNSEVLLFPHTSRRKKQKFAPAGNRTRVCTVAGYYSTTRPLVPCYLPATCLNTYRFISYCSP